MQDKAKKSEDHLSEMQAVRRKIELLEDAYRHFSEQSTAHMTAYQTHMRNYLDTLYKTVLVNPMDSQRHTKESWALRQAIERHYDTLDVMNKKVRKEIDQLEDTYRQLRRTYHESEEKPERKTHEI